jgi:cytochrome o ubiquinol oxidase subunit 2
MHQMMAIDAAGGAGKGAVGGLTRQPWRNEQGDTQRTVVAALCTPANPLGEPLPVAAATAATLLAK